MSTPRTTDAVSPSQHNGRLTTAPTAHPTPLRPGKDAGLSGRGPRLTDRVASFHHSRPKPRMGGQEEHCPHCTHCHASAAQHKRPVSRNLLVSALLSCAPVGGGWGCVYRCLHVTACERVPTWCGPSGTRSSGGRPCYRWVGWRWYGLSANPVTRVSAIRTAFVNQRSSTRGRCWSSRGGGV